MILPLDCFQAARTTVATPEKSLARTAFHALTCRLLCSQKPTIKATNTMRYKSPSKTFCLFFEHVPDV